MLHGAIIHPAKPDESFINSLHAIGGVKWETITPSINLNFFGSPEHLIPAHCNLAVILDPEFTTFAFLSFLVRRGCHLFLTERQLMGSAEREKLIQLAEEGNTFIQTRNDFFVHPAFVGNGKGQLESKLIDIHQVAPGRPGALQEMLYSNLIMILKIVHSEPSRISVCAIPHTGYQPDVVNLHLNFHNGSAASLTLSFVGKEKSHVFSVHDQNGVVNFNFTGKDYHQDITQSAKTVDLPSDNQLLFKQVSLFTESILKKAFHQMGLNDEANTFRLIEKINRKLEFSSVLI
ncbi:MAG: hypothetical protein M0Q53_15840 [Prolixibacteraceae bacterium]|jgi:hypothetical protein|nr:hypothetical protein [Prolixibacteraceae bacterium]